MWRTMKRPKYLSSIDMKEIIFIKLHEPHEYTRYVVFVPDKFGQMC